MKILLKISTKVYTILIKYFQKYHSYPAFLPLYRTIDLDAWIYPLSLVICMDSFPFIEAIYFDMMTGKTKATRN